MSLNNADGTTFVNRLKVCHKIILRHFNFCLQITVRYVLGSILKEISVNSPHGLAYITGSSYTFHKDAGTSSKYSRQSKLHTQGASWWGSARAESPMLQLITPPLPGDISVDNSSRWTPGPAPQETHPTTGPLDGKTPLPRCYLSATHMPLSLHNITTKCQAAYWSQQNWTPQMRC